MKKHNIFSLISLRNLLLLAVGLFFFTGLRAAPEDVNLTGADPNPDFEFNFNMDPIPAGTTFGVENALGNVFWEFASIPPGATGITSTTFTRNGITVTIPGDASESVPETLTATIEGTPGVAESFSFTVTVSDENDPINRTRNRTYVVIISPEMDMVLVLDRSGSMGNTTPAGVTRWQALKDATGNLVAILAALGRTGDNMGLTYFHTAVSQPSAGNFPTPLIPVDNAKIAATISAELNTQSPSGWTAMGSGMKDGQGKITDTSRARFLLLFTDGEQNQSPSVNTDGRGYSDGTSLNSVYPAEPGSIKVFTIGIDSPGGPDLTTLQNLANENRGNYVGTDDGSLDIAFTNQLVNALGSLSPQLIAQTSTDLSNGTTPFSLQTFPLNKNVSKLILKISVDKKFEIPQLLQLFSAITLEKDGVNVTRSVRPSWAGNFTNTLILTVSFDTPVIGVASDSVLTPEGSWTVKLGNTSQLGISECQVTSIADDHRLDYTFSYGSAIPRVNTELKPNLTLTWLSEPVTDATVEAVILRPGEDIGDFLANNPLTVKVSTDTDAPSPGVQKYNQLWSTDSSFRISLAYDENVFSLNHTADGTYENSFNGLTVAGNYQIIYRISGENPEIGKYQRFATESIYTSFNGIDLAASDVATTITDNTMVLTLKPVTSNNKLAGPALAKGFTIDNPNVKIDSIADHQDGSYTITFSGNINEPVSFELMGQEVYEGNLSEIGEPDSLIDRIKDWLESIGLPAWTLWLLLLVLLLLIIILGLSRKK